jgi:hypothetical protein
MARMNVTLDGTEPPIEYIGDWAVMDRDPVTRTTKLARVTELPDGGEKWEYKTLQDCEELIEENSSIRQEQDGQRYGDGNTLVARIPITVWSARLSEALKQGDDAFVKRWLNNPDHAAFRTKSGRI